MFDRLLTRLRDHGDMPACDALNELAQIAANAQISALPRRCNERYRSPSETRRLLSLTAGDPDDPCSSL
jgi:hypothetical protein